MEKIKVLFICHGNICRSPMAEALFRDIADPWYTGNFDETYDDILEGCKVLIEKLKKEILQRNFIYNQLQQVEKK